MSLAYLNPNSVISGDSQWSATGGTNISVLADTSDATYTDPQFLGSYIALGVTTVSLPTGSVMKRMRAVIRVKDQSSGAEDLFRLFGISDNNDSNNYVVNYDSVVSAEDTWTTLYGDYYTGNLNQTQIDQLTVFMGHPAAGSYLDALVSRLYIEFTWVTKPSAPTVSAPTGTKTNDRNPTVSWTYNGDADSDGQTKFQVKIFSDAQYGAGGFDPSTSSATVSSGTITSGSTSWSGYSNLPNNDTYRAYVRTACTTNGVDQWGDWGYSQFVIDVTPSTPTSVTPSTTQTTNEPSIGATVAASPDNLSIRREWQIASDTGFTADVQSYAESTYSTTKSGTVPFPGSWSNLSQGTWYIRCRAQDSDGVYGSYSSYSTFTIAHQPSTTNRNPTGAESLEYTTTPTVDWDFVDDYGNDVQTAFEAELWKLSAPGSPIQSTKTSSANEFYQFSGLDATWKDTELRWRVRVYDVDDVVSAWSSEQAFFLRDLPVPNITAPAGAGGATVTNPTVTWTFTASGGRTQASFHVVVTNTDTAQVVADSGVINGTDLSWQMPEVIQVGPNYSTTITVVDSTGLSGEDTQTFTATYADTTPPSFIVDTSDYTDNSVNLIDWSGATEDTDCQYWRVYRRLTGDTEWTLIHQTADETPRSYYDYSCPANVDVQYAMTQTALQVAVPTESAYEIKSVAASSLYSEYYWLTCPESPSLNLRLYNVKADSFADEQEMSEINLVNRGRQVSYGTRFGQRGSLTTQLWDRPEITAGAQRRKIESLRDSGLAMYLKTPFGDSWAVALTAANVTRIPGLGITEADEVSIDYVEVSAT